MRASLKFFLLAALLAMALGAADRERQWPHWRGPHLDGTSPQAANLPLTWSETENVVWRARLPSWSAATPIVWEDTVFVTSAEEGFTDNTGGSGLVSAALNRIKSALNFSDGLLLIALNRRDGSIRWQQVIGEGNKVLYKQNMASPSPVTDGRYVWVVTGLGELHCFDFNGKKIWNRNLQEDYGEFGLAWGYASSPALYEGDLFIQVLHGSTTSEPSYLLRIDGRSGETEWRAERPTDAESESPDAYSTPMLAGVAGEKQLVIVGGDYLTGHDLNTGRELWRASGLNPDKAGNYRIIASPLVHEDVVFAPSRRRPFIAFRLVETDGGVEPERLWSTRYGPDVPTPVTDGERIYIVDDKGIALCLRVEDGKTVWERNRLALGTYSASPVLAEGRVYATNEEGTTTVFAASAEFKTLAKNELNDYTLASPAVSGEQIFIRTRQYLYCLAKPGAATD